MENLTIAILKETKTPPDKRVPLSPEQCQLITEKNLKVNLAVQKSDIRIFPDEAYENKGLKLVDNVNDYDFLMGVKEVKEEYLIPNKTYFYFSHTIKEQPYNRDLLRKMLSLNITMIDWETLTSPKGPRLIGFGRYAGIVGAYNAFLGLGIKSGAYKLKPANECVSHDELNKELKKVVLPKNYKIALTGEGRVARGAMEILEELGIKQIEPTDFTTQNFEEPVYTQLTVLDYFEKEDGSEFTKNDVYSNPKGYVSSFMQYAKVANMYIAAHFWDSESPFIFSREDAKNPEFNIKIVADISCDIDGPVASTIRPSTIESPLYGYDPLQEKEVEFKNNNAIGVMAVDNLPCELPADASIDFGNEFINNVLPHLLNGDKDGVIHKATICKNGQLTENYRYLQNYVDGN